MNRSEPIIEDDQQLYDWGIENRLEQYYQESSVPNGAPESPPATHSGPSSSYNDQGYVPNNPNVQPQNLSINGGGSNSAPEGFDYNSSRVQPPPAHQNSGGGGRLPLPPTGLPHQPQLHYHQHLPQQQHHQNNPYTPPPKSYPGAGHHLDSSSTPPTSPSPPPASTSGSGDLLQGSSSSSNHPLLHSGSQRQQQQQQPQLPPHPLPPVLASRAGRRPLFPQTVDMDANEVLKVRNL